MKRDVIAPPLESSFLSCEKDTETILKKLFVDSRQHSKTLKRLLVVTNDDCLEDLVNPKYLAAENISIKELIDQQYIVLSPVIRNAEFEKVKAALVLSFDNFTANKTNPQFRDCVISIDVLCHLDCWELQNYQQRPFKILGYIDGILNGASLSGIGRLEFIGCSGPSIHGDMGLFSLIYRAVHGSDDYIEDQG